MTLTGLFFYKECGEHYRTGEIFRQVHSDAYLVLLDKVIPDMPIEPSVIYLISDFWSTDKDDNPIFNFFDTREDLTAWVTWLETPSEKKPSVVNLVKG